MALAISASISKNGFSLDGVEYVELSIKGTTYHVPVPNKEARSDLYYLKKILKGDEDARELLLGGYERKYFFIGDVGYNRWIILTKDDVRVVTNS